MLIAYIVIDIVADPAVLGVVTAHDQIDLLAQVGVAVLLLDTGLTAVPVVDAARGDILRAAVADPPLSLWI